MCVPPSTEKPSAWELSWGHTGTEAGAGASSAGQYPAPLVQDQTPITFMVVAFAG